jgi:hypothetical protein
MMRLSVRADRPAMKPPGYGTTPLKWDFYVVARHSSQIHLALLGIRA